MSDQTEDYANAIADCLSADGFAVTDEVLQDMRQGDGWFFTIEDPGVTYIVSVIREGS